MSVVITTDQLLIDIRNWYHHLRMVQAHLDTSALAGMTPQQLDYCHDVIADLLGACEDATSFILTEARRLETAPEAGLGPGDSSSVPHHGGGE